MAKNKNSNVEPLPAPKAEGAASQKELSNAEIERRLTAMEKTASDFNNRIFDAHKWFTSVITTVIALLLAVVGVVMKNDFQNSLLGMEKAVEKATRDMEKQVQAFVGYSLKKPSVELLHENAPLENRVIDATAPMNVLPVTVSVSSLFIRNRGDKRTEPLSIRVSMAVAVPESTYVQKDWELASSYEKDFPTSFYSLRHVTIAPQETINIHPLVFEGQSFAPWSHPNRETNVLCKIQVFYGGERHSEAQFKLRLRMQ